MGIDSKAKASVFDGVLRRLVQIPKTELQNEDRKYDAAKRQRQKKAAKKKP